MDFVDNQIDPSTGTIQGRALIQNPNGYLIPGLFARVRLLGSGEYAALLIHEAAVLTDLSANLNAPQWPVRLMALTLLAKAQPETFGPVLDWTARHDPQWLNRRMAVALGATPPETDAAAGDKP